MSLLSVSVSSVFVPSAGCMDTVDHISVIVFSHDASQTDFVCFLLTPSPRALALLLVTFFPDLWLYSGLDIQPLPPLPVCRDKSGLMSHLWMRVHFQTVIFSTKASILVCDLNRTCSILSLWSVLLWQNHFNKRCVISDTLFRTVSQFCVHKSLFGGLSSLIHPCSEGFLGCYEKRRQPHPSLVIGPSRWVSANKPPHRLVYLIFS